jgi:hypothetical protein
MVVERQRRAVRPGQDMGDQRLGLGAEGFPAQLQRFSAVRRGRSASSARTTCQPVVDAAQARLPGQGQRVIGGGDAVRRKLPVGFQQRGLLCRHHDAGARHDLALEGIAMDVDEGRGQKAPRAGITAPRRGPRRCR